jgi:hypothetical protein
MKVENPPRQWRVGRWESDSMWNQFARHTRSKPQGQQHIQSSIWIWKSIFKFFTSGSARRSRPKKWEQKRLQNFLGLLVNVKSVPFFVNYAGAFGCKEGRVKKQAQAHRECSLDACAW